MEACDVIIVGGGPAGSACARSLKQAGVDVVVIDKARFPRDKTCAGWITPQVLQSLALDVEEYRASRVFQPITAFSISTLGRRGIEVHFPQPVSYGIRRCEFDEYLLRRSGARRRLGEPVKSIERHDGAWVLNGALRAPLLVGAGGHFCPVARRLRSVDAKEPPLVTAVEAEFDAAAMDGCSAAEGIEPRLYFRDDLAGYGWCVKKGSYLNIGIGLVDSKEAAAALEVLLSDLNADRSFTAELPARPHGHAYYLYDGCRTNVVDDGVLLIGDAAGLAYPQSGEGIRPAIESGLLAARAILDERGDYSKAALDRYRKQLVERFGAAPRSSNRWLSLAPKPLRRALVRRLVRFPPFAREMIIRRWFLHAQQPALVE